MLVEVVGAVIIKDGRILATQRPLNKSLGGYWEFPGGKIESGESPQIALKREIEEELKCNIEVKDFIVREVYRYDFANIALSTYYCEQVSGDITLMEHTDMRWLLPSELDTVEWTPAGAPTLNVLKKLTDNCQDNLY